MPASQAAAGDVYIVLLAQRLLGSSLTKQMLLQPLLNSLLIGVCVSFFAIMIGSVPRVADGSYRSSVQAVLLAGSYHSLYDPELV